MAPAVSTPAAAKAAGSAQFRDGFHHCRGSFPRSGNLDHSVEVGTWSASSGSSPG